MRDQPLTKPEIDHALTHLPGWTWERDALVKTLEFGDFREAMGFMLRAGFEADALDHHPEWTNVYNKVSIRLTTHDAGNKVTAKDVELAGRMEKLRADLTGRA
jgi:4a-hydroxytetrahydrobiopterin dehydratase